MGLPSARGERRYSVNKDRAALVLIQSGFRDVRTLPPCDNAEADLIAKNPRGCWVFSCHTGTDYEQLAECRRRYGAQHAGLIADGQTGMFEKMKARRHGVEVLSV